MNEATLERLVEGTNGDIRAILGQLQMIRLRRSVLSFDDAKVGQSSPAHTAIFAWTYCQPKGSQCHMPPCRGFRICA